MNMIKLQVVTLDLCPAMEKLEDILGGEQNVLIIHFRKMLQFYTYFECAFKQFNVAD